MTTAPVWSDVKDLDPRAAERIAASPSGCWLWTGARTGSGGYGNLYRGGRNVRAHRYVYELLIGPIPDGLQLDHLCRVPQCVNPKHLEPVDSRTNTLRGANAVARHATKGACDAGHRFDEANTYIWRGGRYCRRCRAEAKRRQRARGAA